MKRVWIFAALAVVAATTVSAGLLQTAPQPPVVAANEEIAFLCPMHPDYTVEGEGKCPRCGMALVKAAAFDVRDYRLEFSTVPAVVTAGRKATLHFKVMHPGFEAVIQKFEPVHERQYHLFVISQDMEYFQHLHPEQRPDGTWTLDITLPKPGYYKVLSDFLPSGGSSQFIARPLVTAGYAGDLAADSARLTPDASLMRTVGDITAHVVLDPPQFAAGVYGHLNFRLSDTATGRPVTDLQTYLGAFGHTLIMSEDRIDYVHSHPLDLANLDEDGGARKFMLPAGVDPETLRGGPEVTFEGLMPRAGRYRAWTQFRRNDKLYTFTTTFAVSE